jgi:hypothetical protein
MSLKSISVTAVARVLATVGVIGGATLLAQTAVASLAQDEASLTEAQSAAAAELAQEIADAVAQAALENPGADEATLKAAVEKAIADVLTASGADSAVVTAALAQAQTIVARNPALAALSNTVVAIVNQTRTAVLNAVQAQQQANAQGATETAAIINLPNGRRVTIPLPPQSQGQPPVYVGRGNSNSNRNG